MAPQNLPDEVRVALDNFNDFKFSSYNSDGANGYVIIGKHKILGIDAVIKTYYREDCDDFEPAALAQCDHENIVKIYDARYNAESKILYYFMEKCDGTVATVNIYNGHSTKSLLEFIKQICHGASHFHTLEEPFVHRDIKTDNILLKNNKIKICDFGSAIRISNGVAPSGPGSILYKAPENKDGAHYIQSDIYQIGIVAYVFFGGALNNNLLDYFPAQTSKKIQKQEDSCEKSKMIDDLLFVLIKKGKLLRKKSLPKFIPNKILRIIDKLTDIDYNKRYKSCADVIIDIQNVGDFLDVTQDTNGLVINYKSQEYKISQLGKDKWLAFKKKQYMEKDFCYPSKDGR